MRFSKALILGFCLTFSCVAGAAGITKESAVLTQIHAAIAGVRSGKTVDARRRAAEHLECLTEMVKGKVISTTLVADIASLLDSPDDSVRYSVVLALGNLGPAAKSAAPKLLKILPEEDCDNGPITTGGAIRYALVRMGIKPPPRPDCVRISG